MNTKSRDTILLVEDSASTRAMLRGIFENTYNILEAENGEQALHLLKQSHENIAAVLLDLVMAGINGYQVLEEMRRIPSFRQIPVVVVTAYGNTESELQALRLGAIDVIVKPFEAEVARQRVENVVELYRHKWYLEELVAEQSNSLRHSNEVLVDALSNIIEHRSLESGQHVLRIRSFTSILLKEVARCCPQHNLDDATISTISSASALHDIGKISVPDAILNKPGRLTPEEFAVMKNHTTAGSNMLERLYGLGNEEYLYFAYNICRYHHERWDGKGYPEGLKEDAIPLCAQVVSIADVYDALTAKRVYKPAFSHEKACHMILNGECGAFSPELLECFKAVLNEFADTANSYSDDAGEQGGTVPPSVPSVSYPPEKLDATQLVQMKYQALLSYVNATVVEFDLDYGLYHMIYNTNQDWSPLEVNCSFEGFVEHYSLQGVHPEDVGRVRKWYGFLSTEFFQLGLPRASLTHRIFSPSLNDYQKYTVTALRLTGASSHRKLLLVWDAANAQGPRQGASSQPGGHIPEEAARRILNSVLHYQNDKAFTILNGVEVLTRLTGYSRQEIAEQFHNSLLEMVVPEDRLDFHSQIREQLLRGRLTELQYRLPHKDGQIIWVLDKGHLSTGCGGMECFYSILTDSTRTAESQEQIRALLERNQIAVEQAGNIVFEWDMAEDTLTCSSKWEEQFGYPPLSRDFSKQLSRSAHFHPDDAAILLKNMERARKDLSNLEMEVRITNGSGRYVWCHLRATVLRDAQSRPLRAVGSILNIDEMKRSIQNLQERANQDALTRLLNKDAVRGQVMDFLAHCDPDCHCALLFIDLDYFKQVNDQYGHLFGDTTLSRAAEKIRGLFRSHDIIGRIGGDEFMVFMRNIPHRSLVENRCLQLNAAFRSLFQEELPDCPLSCSIGVALFPENGTTYQDLFQRADQALYQAKAQGRNCYAFYQPDAAFTPPSLSTIGTRIDSDERPGMADRGLAWDVFRRLYEADDIYAAINNILALVGQQMNVSRVYIFENNADNTACRNTFEWCNEGIKPEIGNLQHLSYETDIPGYLGAYNEQDVFYSPDISALSRDLYGVLSPQGIRSLVHCAIRDNGVFRGYVGFDECFSNRIWTQAEIDLLTFLSKVLALFLLKRRAQDETEKKAEGLNSVLDGQNAFIYVIDQDYRIRFLNAKTVSFAPEVKVGMLCHQAIMHRDAPCENCPGKRIREGTIQACIIENPVYGLKVQAEASFIRWEGEDARLIICRDVRATYTEPTPLPNQ